MGALPRKRAVIYVFPKSGSYLEVDNDVGLLTRIVHEEPYTFHITLL
jgi:hypothetical protein